MRAQHIWPTLPSLGLLLALGGCFGPEYGDRAFSCTRTDPTCPEGYGCLLQTDSFFCVLLKNPPSVQASAKPASVRLANPTAITLDIVVDPNTFFLDTGGIDGDPQPGRGHYHLNLRKEGQTGDSFLGFLSAKARPRLAFVKNSATTPPQGVDLVINANQQGLQPGNHTLVLVLVQNNHKEIQPRVTAEVKIQLRP